MRVYVIEGPDRTGKSVLAKFLSNSLKAPIFKLSGHPALHPAMPEYHERVLSDVEWCAKELNMPVIMERSWVSEQIYGSLLRPYLARRFPYADHATRLRRLGAIYIYCVPPSIKGIVKRHADDKDPEHPYSDKVFEYLATAYEEFFTDRETIFKDVMRYSIEKYGSCLEKFLSMITRDPYAS